MSPPVELIDCLIEDRGPAEYFHGRRGILDAIQKRLRRTRKDEIKGTTILIEGAPGAGKTALLDQCAKMAEAQGWEVAAIEPQALFAKDALREARGDGVRGEKTSFQGGVGIPGGISAGMGIGWTPASPFPTMREELQRGAKPLLLVLDEAQRLQVGKTIQEHHEGVISSVLHQIHNGRVGKPVVLLSGGLGRSREGFRRLGVSRWKGNCFVELGALSKDAARAVIQDWLVKGGGAEGDVSPWVDAITSEGHGWPQHLMAYCIPAQEYLRQRGDGEMNAHGLQRVLATGRELRRKYYEGRFAEIRPDQSLCLASALAKLPAGQPIDYGEIMPVLSDKYSPEEAKDLFRKFLDNGIIEQRTRGYAIPIPSMQTWLVETYALGTGMDWIRPRKPLECPRNQSIPSFLLKISLLKSLPRLHQTTKSYPIKPKAGSDNHEKITTPVSRPPQISAL